MTDCDALRRPACPGTDATAIVDDDTASSWRFGADVKLQVFQVSVDVIFESRSPNPRCTTAYRDAQPPLDSNSKLLTTSPL